MTTELRPSILKAINSTLNNTRAHLSSFDFTIEQKDGQLTIVYNYRPETFIKIFYTNKEEEYTETQEKKNAFLTHETTTQRITKKDFLISGNMSPGQLSNFEEFDFYGVLGIRLKVENWVISLWEDLSADPIVRSINEKQSELETYLNQFPFDNIVNGDEYFSNDEITQIKDRLKNLEDKIATDLKEAIEDKELLKTEQGTLKKEFEALKQTIPNLTRKNWFKSSLSKLFIWGAQKKYQPLIKAATSYGKSLIEGAIENS
jgi:hypothetical protein